MSLDPATPAPRSRGPVRFIVVGVLVLVLVLAAAWFGGRSWADGKADDYRGELAAWQEKDGAALLASTAKVPSGTYLLKDVAKKKNLATQKKGCAEVADVAAQAGTASKSLPTVSSGFAGFFSSDLRDAADEAEDVRREVKAYATKAEDTFEQIHVDCTWNIALNTPTKAEKKSTTLYEQSAKYLDPKGQTTPTVVCNEESGCISNTRSKRLKYADLRAQAYRNDMNNGLKNYDTRCDRTSYGSAMCKAFREATRRYADVRLEQASVVRTITTSVDNPEIDRINDKWESVEDSNGKLLRSTMAKAHPAAYKDVVIKKSPGFSDRFLRFEARRLVAQLARDRAALEKALPKN